MEDSQYKNREIDEKFSEIRASLGRIEIQTTKHNGRMDKLEIRQDKFALWQSYVIGFCACVVLILLPVALMVAQILFRIKG